MYNGNMDLPANIEERPSLTGHQHQFVSLYLSQTRGDAVAAVRLMGLSDEDCVNKRLANRFLSHPAVQWHINRFASQHMAPTEILALLAAHARGDQGDFWDQDDETGGLRLNFKRVKELGLTRLIRTLQIGKDGQVKLELYDAQSAARDLMKVQGMTRKDSNVHILVEQVVRGLDGGARAELVAALGALMTGDGELSDVIDAKDIIDMAVVVDEESDHEDEDEDAEDQG